MQFNLPTTQIHPKGSEVITLTESVTDQATKQNYHLQLKLYANSTYIKGEDGYTVGMPINDTGEAVFPLNAHFGHPKTKIPDTPIASVGDQGHLQNYYNEGYLAEYSYEAQTAWLDPNANCGLVESGFVGGETLTVGNAKTASSAQYQNYVGSGGALEFLASYPEGYEIPYDAPIWLSLYSAGGSTAIEATAYFNTGGTQQFQKTTNGTAGVHTFNMRAATLTPVNEQGFYITHATVQTATHNAKTISYLPPDDANGCCAVHLAFVGSLGNFDYVWGISQTAAKSQLTDQIVHYAPSGRTVLATDGDLIRTTFIRSDWDSSDYIDQFLLSKEHYWYNEEAQEWQRIVPVKKVLDLYKKKDGYVWSEFGFYVA